MATPEAKLGICHDRRLPIELEEDGRRAAVRKNPTNDVDPILDPNFHPCSHVMLHRFDHALGAVDEHRNPQGGIVWGEEAVYRHVSGPPND